MNDLVIKHGAFYNAAPYLQTTINTSFASKKADLRWLATLGLLKF